MTTHRNRALLLYLALLAAAGAVVAMNFWRFV